MSQSAWPTPKAILLLAVLGWVYWPTLADLYDVWTTSPDYSHGLLVPLFSLWLLFRKPANPNIIYKPWPLLGFAGLTVSVFCRLFGAGTSFLPLEGLSLIMALASAVMLSGGWGGVRRFWQPLLFLVFMVPLPYEFSRAMGAELQRIATMCSTFLLRCCGQPAIAEGNRILIENITLNVVEACSGLRMLMTFIAFSIAAVFMMERHWMVRGIVLLSAVPIALATNILRISATGLAHVWLHDSDQKAKVMDFIHDFNGWMMMPVGLAMLLAELWVLKNLLIETAKRAAPSFTPRPPNSPPVVKPANGKPKFVSVIRMPQTGS
ncbi:exosortase/archaeosortase family protein [Zavarzinella formosa]|uniref:exosortase/archaeosortase family protein n=1 Tax=Zavarzinella formosa TaxID=360055 RepID=UPI0002E950F8|nr:exosortase/archaeosortase family protein [Zavarzinella formosa]